MEKQKKSRISIAIFVFILGILALLALIGYSLLHRSDKIILAGEGVALLSLVGLLIYAIINHRRQVAAAEQNMRSPYGEVNKNEISKIFDMIATEERRRGRTVSITSKDPVPAEKEAAAEETKAAPEPEKPEQEDNDDSSEEEKLPIIFPDMEESEDNNTPSFIPLSEERAVARREKREQDAKKAKEDAEKRELADISAEDGQNSDAEDKNNTESSGADIPKEASDVTKGGKGMDNNGRPRRRPPAQQDVYYDAYGRPIAAPPASARAPQAPVGYDAYGRPIYAPRPAQKKPRVPVGYDAYGRPIYAPAQKKPRVPVGYDAYGRPIYAQPQNRAPGGRPGQPRRRPGPGPGAAAPGQIDIVPGMDQDLQTASQLPNQPMAASAADALASIEAQQPAQGQSYYDEDYIPVVVHDDENVNYDDGRYTPRLQSSFEQVSGGNPDISPTAPLRVNDEYNFNGAGNVTYRPEYDVEDMPVVVPSFEDAETDYSTPQGFTMPSYMPKAHAGIVAAPPVVPASAAPSRPASSRALDPSYNAAKASDYKPDDEDRFVFVPRFDDDDPEPPAPAEPPKPPRWKMVKMRRRKVRRRSRRGMLFKVRTDSFVDYTKAKLAK